MPVPFPFGYTSHILDLMSSRSRSKKGRKRGRSQTPRRLLNLDSRSPSDRRPNPRPSVAPSDIPRMFKQHGVCPTRHAALADTMLTGKEPKELVFPTQRNMDLSQYTLAQLPNKYPAGIAFSQTNTFRITVGTAGVGFGCFWPQAAPYQDVNGLHVTDSGYAGATFVPTLPVGTTQAPIAPLAPYLQSKQDLQSYVMHLSATMKASSATSMNNSGRMYLGHSLVTATGFTGTNFGASQQFATHTVASINERNMPRLVWVPDNYATYWPPTVTGVTHGFGVSVIFIEGAAAGTVFEFELKTVCAYVGSYVPYKTSVVYDQNAIDCTATCLARSLPRGNTFDPRAEGSVARDMKKHLDVEATKSTSFLGAIWDGAKWLWNHGGSSLLETAIASL